VPASTPCSRWPHQNSGGQSLTKPNGGGETAYQTGGGKLKNPGRAPGRGRSAALVLVLRWDAGFPGAISALLVGGPIYVLVATRCRGGAPGAAPELRRARDLVTEGLEATRGQIRVHGQTRGCIPSPQPEVAHAFCDAADVQKLARKLALLGGGAGGGIIAFLQFGTARPVFSYALASRS